MTAGAWNRSEDSTAAGVNLDAAPFGFKVTGDAAWDYPDGEVAAERWAGMPRLSGAAL